MREQLHFNTYGGNPVSMAAGQAVVDCIEKNNYRHNAKVMGDPLAEGFDELARAPRIVGEHDPHQAAVLHGSQRRRRDSRGARRIVHDDGEGIAQRTVAEA
jgi:adenosylmethionine-8-amino-7-oxononanoate aminotransferase